MADLGKVGIVAKGTWSNSSTYEVLDAVYYNNETYIAKQAVPAGTLPTNTTYWQPALTSNVQNGAITSPVSIYSSSLKRNNHVVELYLEVYPINTITSGDTIGILPEGFRPSYRRNPVYVVLNASGNDVAGHCQIAIDTSGNIKLNKMPDLGSSNGFLAAFISYMV